MTKSMTPLKKGAQIRLVGNVANTEGTGEVVPQFKSMKNFRSRNTYAPAP